MRSEEELTSIFTDYFGDKLTAAQIDRLVTDVRTSVQNRHGAYARSTQQTHALSVAPGDQRE
jgi:hypothetical protein